MPNELLKLKPTPVSAPAEGQAPIFVATSKEGSFVTPVQPLRWWYRLPGENASGKTAAKRRRDDASAWKPIESGGLLALDQNLRVVHLFPEQLDLRGADSFAIAVTEGVDSAVEDIEEADTLWYKPLLQPAETAFHIDGHGTHNGGEHPRHVEVTMSRTKVPPTKDEILWIVIRNSANSLGFTAYQDFMDALFTDPRLARANSQDRKLMINNIEVPLDAFVFSSVDSYRVLKVATEVFVMTHCGVVRPPHMHPDAEEEEARFGHHLPDEFKKMWKKYLVPLGNVEGRHALILPYLDLIRRKLGDIGSVRASFAATVDQQAGLLQEKLVHPCMLELIWSYWMEEGMLVQSFNGITRRFQNLRSNGERDPLAQLELDPLRPVNNLLWGWVQDEQSRLSVLRRAHEYDHQYGFTLHGKALADLRTIDRRSKFLEAFHNLLWRCTQFYRQDDDTTVIADGFPMLNALKETHYLLAHGAHNQFGNLPSTSRQEMLMQQWILSRPEMREFLGARVMVPYPESWMDRVDAVKTLKGWTDTSVVHFRDLAVFGEQLLLSVRYGAWSTINDPNSAANWARYWRAEVQGYIHAYRAATSVDLTADITDQRQAETRFLPPSVHLRNRLQAQASR